MERSGMEAIHCRSPSANHSGEAQTPNGIPSADGSRCRRKGKPPAGKQPGSRHGGNSASAGETALPSRNSRNKTIPAHRHPGLPLRRCTTRRLAFCPGGTAGKKLLPLPRQPARYTARPGGQLPDAPWKSANRPDRTAFQTARVHMPPHAGSGDIPHPCGKAPASPGLKTTWPSSFLAVDIRWLTLARRFWASRWLYKNWARATDR